jgi:hypothetical protein
MNQACRSGPEAARIEIERLEARIEVNMHPFAAGALGVLNGTANKFGADASPLKVSADLRINQERVVTSIPSDVDKADGSPIPVWALIWLIRARKPAA